MKVRLLRKLADAECRERYVRRHPEVNVDELQERAESVDNRARSYRHMKFTAGIRRRGIVPNRDGAELITVEMEPGLFQCFELWELSRKERRLLKWNAELNAWVWIVAQPYRKEKAVYAL